VKVEHDENSAVSSGFDDLVHHLQRGETLQVGVGAVIDAGGGSIVDGKRQVERQLHEKYMPRLVVCCIVYCVGVGYTRIALNPLLARKSRKKV
jgi:hypothetical protein